MKVQEKFAFDPRIIRSPLGDCWGKEIETLLEAYPDEYLRSIAGDGYNGVWVHVRFRETVPSPLFPGRKEKQRGNLNTLVERAAVHGMKVYCYLLEPRALPESDPFWKKHPGLLGQRHFFGDDGLPVREHVCALCTSTPEVKAHLEESAFNLFSLVPGLGGAFLITASESHTHCYSHFPHRGMKNFTDPYMADWARRPFTCPRCALRTPTEVAAEAINLISRGIRRAEPGAEVIAWTWSWYILGADPQEDLLERLDRNVTLMSDFDRGGRKKIAGRFFPVDEYSFAYIGPSPRFRKYFEAARARGLKVMAKIQTSNTHELAAVPYIPVPYQLAERYRRMREMGVSGYLGCWIFGGNASPMTKVAGIMSRADAPSPSEAVARVAREEFGTEAAPAVCRAWRKFSRAWREYPFSIPFLYYGPINYATAYPLRLESGSRPPTGAWLPLPRDEKGFLDLGENTVTWLHPFGAETAVEAFERLLAGWREGVGILEAAAAGSPGNARLAAETDLARHIMLSVTSTINIISFYRLREQYRKTKSEKARKNALGEIASIFRAELNNAALDRELVSRNRELGYHAEAHTHLFTVRDLDHKMAVLREELDRLEKVS